MSVKSTAYLKSLYGSTRTPANKTTSPEMTLEVVGVDTMIFVLKGFSIPLLSPAGVIEVPMPLGGTTFQPKNIKNHFRQLVTLVEIKGGTLEKFIKDFATKGRFFEAFIYQGTPDNFTRKDELFRCRLLQLDQNQNGGTFRHPSAAGTLHFHYFE
jgi:hypothetical protein